ncbi:hypothetical protein JI721_05470 [Alicyclobacillus cycloheptanicus]|uniref:Small secreted protein n=1 Tax=Alicyclobacillus cycloheptanicus TaxID=1457 RepID=A0ABT9XGG3_9BACL|nr:hypothetical protein [Alicyclobacillus cycloheptanicus]MDQ0189386.1 hypothetical protein [Alicyclobacillus cycloheptanicus]WDM02262.1 hypothetical protein JI721_05470 [Alicyclobacillus cycloheptanicus]
MVQKITIAICSLGLVALLSACGGHTLSAGTPSSGGSANAAAGTSNASMQSQLANTNVTAKGVGKGITAAQAKQAQGAVNNITNVVGQLH